jgi:hypothetical protein
MGVWLWVGLPFSVSLQVVRAITYAVLSESRMLYRRRRAGQGAPKGQFALSCEGTTTRAPV